MQYQYTQGDQDSPSLLRRMPNIHRTKSTYENSDRESFVPPDPVNHEPANSSNDDSSQTLTNGSDTEQQFDKISTKVNEAIKNLSSIYSQIGYTAEETAEKKAEIFQVINDTVASFKDSLQREKENIENECEWLRQQIRIILAMLDDTTGERTLRQSHRGIVFADEALLREGYQEDMYQKMQQQDDHMMLDFDTSISTNGTTRCVLPNLAGPESRVPSFTGQDRGVSGQKYPSLEVTNENTSMSQSYDYKNNQKLPKPSLLQCKIKLNSIFLEALKAFVGIFNKFNELNRLLWENLESIYDESQYPSASSILSSIPDRATAEEHAKLIDDFYLILDKLNLNRHNFSPESSFDGRGRADEENAFIISSPRKQKMSVSEPSQNVLDHERDEWMNRLRETNYKIVRIIRNLKITKLTNEVIQTLNNEIAHTERELQQRTKDMKCIIKDCLTTINVLSLSEKDIISLQRMQDQKRDSQSPNGSCDGFFDIETLKFIETNPREFGLSDHHLNFITKLSNTLEALKEAKQKKWDHYHKACQALWEKLHENEQFVSQFLATNSNLTDAAIMNLKMELQRLHMKRSEFVENFIMDSRKQIQELQTKLLFSEYQCRQFKYYAYDINEDAGEDKEMILSEHEAEIERLTEEYQEKEPILSLYSQLNELTEDQKFLVESSKDSSRLLSKNSCKILLNEEKIRKKVARNLPRILTSIKQEIISFNNKQLSAGKRTISVDGEDLFEKVLLIESNSGAFAGKSSRGKVQPTTKKTPATMRSTSPAKRPFGASRSSSPIKSSHSPSKVTKLNSRPVQSQVQSKNSTLNSNYRPASIPGERSPTKSSLNLNSVDLKSSLEVKFSLNKDSSKLSPMAKQRGPRNGALSHGSTHLRPLQSPLTLDADSMRDHYQGAENESAGNTLYSTCSKTSPLRSRSTNDSFGNISAGNAKFYSGPDYLMDSSDDENKENPLAQARNLRASGFETPRLSSGSFANSTIIGDDYQSWREERIKQMNHEV